jgi:hypothetical protein
MAYKVKKEAEDARKEKEAKEKADREFREKYVCVHIIS